MQRVTVTLDDELVAELDRFMQERGYSGRSEAFRDLARAGLAQVQGEAHQSGECVASLVYVFNYQVRELSKRLSDIYHRHHDLTRATLRVHLDHETCLETIILCGSVGQVKALAESIIAERGVLHGRLTLVPVQVSVERHSHGGKAHEHTHIHVRQGGSV